MIQRGFEVVPELLRLLRSQANDLWKAGVRSELPWSRSVRMPVLFEVRSHGGDYGKPPSGRHTASTVPDRVQRPRNP